LYLDLSGSRTLPALAYDRYACISEPSFDDRYDLKMPLALEIKPVAASVAASPGSRLMRPSSVSGVPLLYNPLMTNK
jgi:hypothetical protein